MQRTIISCFLLTAALLALPASAQAEGETNTEKYRNEIGFFVGGTGNNRRENGLTLSVNYERRFNKTIGLSFEAERVLGDLDFWVAGILGTYHYKQWKFFAGPGIEMPDDSENEFLARIGGEYAFELDAGWEISPTLAMDFVDSETEIIAGVLISYNY